MFKIDITKDTKGLEMLKKNLQKQMSMELELGFFPEARYEDGTQVAQVAQWNFEGSVTNPPRPAFQQSILAPIERGQYKKMFDASIARALSRGSFTAEYNVIGKQLQAILRQSIIDWSTPPNSPRTIAEKGFNDPLIETGLMRDSVDYKVTKRGGD